MRALIVDDSMVARQTALAALEEAFHQLGNPGAEIKLVSQIEIPGPGKLPSNGSGDSVNSQLGQEKLNGTGRIEASEAGSEMPVLVFDSLAGE